MRSRKPIGPALAIVAGGLIALVVMLTAADALATGARIHRGVRAAGVDLGGMTRPEAVRALRVRLEPALRKDAVVTYGARRWVLRPSKFSLQVDFDSSAARAASVGRDSNAARNVLTRLGLWFRHQDAGLALSANEDRVQAALGEMAAAVGRAPVNASIRVEGRRVVAERAREGRSLVKWAARRAILACMVSSTARTAELPVVAVPVGIDDAAAAGAYRQARRMLAGPLLLKHRKSQWEVSPERVGRWIVFRRVLSSGRARANRVGMSAALSQPAVARAVAGITKATRHAPRDAQFKVVGERVKIVPSHPGVGVDTRKAYGAIRVAVLKPRGRTVLLVDGPLQPRMTTEWARSTGITQLLGTYTTNYDPGQTSRVANIHLLLKHLNNTFVRPRAVFSFNKTIGPRTAEKGYQEAPAIQDGRLVPSLGGGVCQVGTTLFNSVFFSGLDVVERHNHSFYISHYPDGRDATVSWDGPDLRFRNDTPAWVLVKAWWGDDWVTISLYGADVGNDVSYRTGEFGNFTEPPVEQVQDPMLAVGQTSVDDEGIRGRDITVWRTVRRKDKIIHRDVFESHYAPKDAVVSVGAKAAPKRSKEPSAPPSR